MTRFERRTEGTASAVGNCDASSKTTTSNEIAPGFRYVDTEIGLINMQGFSACRTCGISEKSFRSGFTLFFFCNSYLRIPTSLAVPRLSWADLMRLDACEATD